MGDEQVGALRILTMCGSLGAASANRSILGVVTRVLTEQGADVADDMLLGTLPPLQPELVDAAGDAVDAFRRQIAHADAVIIAAPEYAGSLSGTVKNALDWVVGTGELYAKPVGILSAGTTGGPFARQVLARTLVWQGAHVVAQLGVTAPGAKSDADGTISDAATIATLELFAGAVLRAVRATVDERVAASELVSASLGVRGHLDGALIALSANFG